MQITKPQKSSKSTLEWVYGPNKPNGPNEPNGPNKPNGPNGPYEPNEPYEPYETQKHKIHKSSLLQAEKKVGSR